MRVSVVLLLLKVGDSHQSLSMGREESDLTRYVRFARRRNRPRYFLHVFNGRSAASGVLKTLWRDCFARMLSIPAGTLKRAN